MLEITTETIILGEEDLGEYDGRVHLYTREFGKISAKAASLRKITSKLSAYLEPLNYSNIRLVYGRESFQSKDFQIVDALNADDFRYQDLPPEKIKEILDIFKFINSAVPEGVFDHELWDFLMAVRLGQTIPIQEVLKLLGFDLKHSSCEICQKLKPEYFFSKDHFFICQQCFLYSQETKGGFVLVQ